MLTDIDGTLTDGERLPTVAYDALERLHASGLLVVPVTGRPAGWCDLIARQWPVHAVVGENGAFWFHYDKIQRRMVRHFARPDAMRAQDHARLQAIARQILRKVPQAALAADQPYRSTDIAIDIAEDVAPLSRDQVDTITAAFEAAGATAKVSSIHVNAWFGTHDKLTMSLSVLREVFGIDGEAEAQRIIFAGDSPNDAPMFAHFPNAVGVANVRDYADRMSALPAYITLAPAARGFAELADVLVSARQPGLHKG